MRVNENLWRGSHTYAFCLGGYLWVARRWDTYVSADQKCEVSAGRPGGGCRRALSAGFKEREHDSM